MRMRDIEALHELNKKVKAKKSTIENLRKMTIRVTTGPVNVSVSARQEKSIAALLIFDKEMDIAELESQMHDIMERVDETD